jgi:hypothetical protein
LRFTFLAHLILVDLITLKYLVRYRSHEPPLHNFLMPPAPFSRLGPNTVLNPVSSDTVSFLPLLWDTPSFSAMQNDKEVTKYVLWKLRAFRYGLYILCQRCCVLKHDAVCLAVDRRRFLESCSCRCAG